jgi:uncharacterized protein
MTELETFRVRKDEFFRTHPQSPLSPEEQQDFGGLVYFPERPDLRFDVVVEPFPDKQTITMQTSTGDAQAFVRYGTFAFTVDGQEAQLTVYANEQGIFLPFADALAGSETYGAGRYLEPELLGDGRLHVDFNLAYNPYCAYNDAWSCPITPLDNRLKVPIRAGEKLFHVPESTGV